MTGRLKQFASRLLPKASPVHLTKREQFLAFVFIGSLAEDLAQSTQNAQLIAELATNLSENAIPENAFVAAQTFLDYCAGRTTKPEKWML